MSKVEISGKHLERSGRGKTEVLARYSFTEAEECHENRRSLQSVSDRDSPRTNQSATT